MTIMQFLRIVWARKWLVFGLLVVVAIAGTAITLLLPKQYTAETSLIVEMRVDPVLGVLAPSLAQPSYIATQVDILKSERVATRVVNILQVERSAASVAQWRDQTQGKIPIDRYFANLLQRGLVIEPGQGSNVINLKFSAQDPIFAQSAANAFAQAYLDVSVDLRVAPARDTERFLDSQTKVLLANLEAAQARLTKFQQEHGIVGSDDRFNQEDARYQQLNTQLINAQADAVEAANRERLTGGAASPDVASNPAVLSLRGQLATAEATLTDLSQRVGKNHPQRIEAETRVAELNRQINAEIRRVSVTTGISSRAAYARVAQLQSMVNEQGRKIQSMKGGRDEEAVYKRDLDIAQRAYEINKSKTGVAGQETQNNQANTRILSPAVEPLEPSKPKVAAGIAASILGGLALGMIAALGWEMLDRRVRDPEDLMVMAGVPVIGVLRPEGSKRPVFRRLLQAGPLPSNQALLPAPGGRP